MKRILIVLFLGIVLTEKAFADAYKANIWASWASITNEVKWSFPYNSRQITIINGGTVPVCVAFNNNPIGAACNTTQGTVTNDNRVFQIPNGQNFMLNDTQQQAISLKSPSGTAASPVSVVVAY